MSTEHPEASAAAVGPVLRRSPISSSLIEAMRVGNPRLEVVDRGGYLRVFAPERLRVDRTAVEAVSGRPFVLPGDLEQVMVSFSGLLRVTADLIEWRAR